ncbi:MAG: glycosyltransferase [Nitrososphaerota archaeon]
MVRLRKKFDEERQDKGRHAYTTIKLQQFLIGICLTLIRMNEEDSSSGEFPLVPLLCDSKPFSIVRYFEHALYEVANVIPVYLDVHEWFIKKLSIPSLLYKLLNLRLSRVKPIPREPDTVLMVEPPIKRPYDLGKFRNSIKVFYALDPHTSNAMQAYRKCELWNYDFVFVGQKDYIWMFKEMGCDKVFWLPYAYDPRIFREIPGLQMVYDVTFLGYMNEERRHMLDALKKRFKMFTTDSGKFAFMHDASSVYSKSKIVLQISNNKTLGSRIFEAMGCRRMVLADRIKNGLEDIFKEGTHIALYSDLDELIELIKYYLEDEGRRELLANNGYRLVRTSHTYKHRVITMMESLGIKLPQSFT